MKNIVALAAGEAEFEGREVGLLADDLRRFLDGKPILARPTPWWERTWKWVRRHPALAVVTVASQGHAPLLKDGPTIEAIRQFLDATDVGETMGTLAFA